MKKLRQLYYTLFKHYNVLETKCVTYKEGDKMLTETSNSQESEKWVLAKEEDTNRMMGMVYLCRKVRITGMETT